MSHSPVVKDLMLSPLLGIFGTMVLYGVTCMQTFQYYSNYPQDSIRMKAMVATIFVLGTIQTAFAANYVGYYLIDRYGDLDALARIQWTVPASAVIGFVITWAVNQFFVRRIYLLSKKNLWLAIFIGILATLRPGFGLAACAMTVVHNDWATFTERARWIMVCGLSIGPVVDWLITLCLAYQLLKGWGPNTIAEPTRNIINTLLKYTVNTGVILSVFAVFELITLLTARKTLFFLGIFQVQIQLYTNFFLATLLARQPMREEMPTVISFKNRNASGRSRPPLAAGIQIKTETFVASDADRRASRPDWNKVSFLNHV